MNGVSKLIRNELRCILDWIHFANITSFLFQILESHTLVKTWASKMSTLRLVATAHLSFDECWPMQLLMPRVIRLVRKEFQKNCLEIHHCGYFRNKDWGTQKPSSLSVHKIVFPPEAEQVSQLRMNLCTHIMNMHLYSDKAVTAALWSAPLYINDA